jgi:secreted trypsin-like serine protease
MIERMKGNCYIPIVIWMLNLVIRCCTGQESSSNNIFSISKDEEDRSHEQVGKIIGGSQVTAGTYPWFARPTVNFFSKWAGCGGSLISSQFVLTAAHCVDDTFGDFAGHGYQIGALCSPYTSGDNCGQTIENISIKQKFIHPSYKAGSLTYDMALMQLDGASSITPINFDDGSFSSNYTSGMVPLYSLDYVL